ncbi:hypothetical protein BH11GEM1_BH11GEM1_34250 [soil metagenome]
MIPYYNPQQGVAAWGTPAGGAWQGYTMFWTDQRLGGWQRPVVAIRGGTHGSYMAQDCSNAPYGGTTIDPWGMWRGSIELYGNLTACIHDDATLMVYMPGVQGSPTSPTLPASQSTGTFLYDLQELYQSPLWSLRSAPDQIWASGTTSFGYGGATQSLLFKMPDFVGSTAVDAPWNWAGGRGNGAQGLYWYHFGKDATGQFDSPQDWYQESGFNTGGLVLAPSALTQRRLPGLPDLAQPMRYNPYLTSPPDYNTPPPPALLVDIVGPDAVPINTSATWSATASGGSGGPYQYAWSGISSGSGTTVTANVYASGTLYLDVTDLITNQHVAVSKYIQATTSCPNNQITC